MKRIIRTPGKLPVPADGGQGIGRFNGDLYFIKPQVLQKPDVSQGAFDEGLGVFRAGISVFIQQVLLDRSAVHPDPDRHMMLFCGCNNPGQFFRPSQIAGIDPNGLGAIFHRCHSQTMVEMDIGNQRYGYCIPYGTQGKGSLSIYDSDPDQLTARQLKGMNLSQGGRHIPGVRIGH